LRRGANPSTTACGGGPPPHCYATGRNLARRSSSLSSRSVNGEGDRSRSEWWRGKGGTATPPPASTDQKPKRRTLRPALPWHDRTGACSHRQSCGDTSHTRTAPASPGGVSASRRSASMRATSALMGIPSAAARSFSMVQNTGSRLIEVLWPAISTERLTGGWKGAGMGVRWHKEERRHSRRRDVERVRRT